MIHTISEVVKITGLSKVTIYKRIKLPSMQKYITKKQGKTAINDAGVNEIKASVKINTKSNDKEGNKADAEPNKHYETAINEEFVKVSKDYLNRLTLDIEKQSEQLEEKDTQIKTLHAMLTNMQVLMREQNELKLLEEKNKRPMKGIFRNLFKRSTEDDNTT